MFTNFDCDCFYVADRKALIQTLSVLPEYLRNQATESGAVIDYRDWQIPLGRRFRALKLWFVIRHYGVEGCSIICAEHVALAQQFADWVRRTTASNLPPRRRLTWSASGSRRGDAANQATARPPESLRRSLPDPHQAGRPLHAAFICGPDQHEAHGMSSSVATGFS